MSSPPLIDGAQQRDKRRYYLQCKRKPSILYLEKNLKNFESYSKDEIYDHRKSKFLLIGRDQGFSKSSNIADGGLSYKESALNKFKSQINKNKYVYGGVRTYHYNCPNSLIILVLLHKNNCGK